MSNVISSTGRAGDGCSSHPCSTLSHGTWNCSHVRRPMRWLNLCMQRCDHAALTIDHSVIQSPCFTMSFHESEQTWRSINRPSPGKAAGGYHLPQEHQDQQITMFAPADVNKLLYTAIWWQREGGRSDAGCPKDGTESA